MPIDMESELGHLEHFMRTVLEPAVHPDAEPLAVSVHQCHEPVSVTDVARRSFQPVETGWRWGPVWSTAWFRVPYRMPRRFAGRTVAFRFSCGTEALLWQDGTPRQGFDRNRSAHILAPRAVADDEGVLWIEAACSDQLGATTFGWDDEAVVERWKEALPGRLERCELAVFEPVVWRLRRELEFARQLLALHEADNAGAEAVLPDGMASRVCDAVRTVIGSIDEGDVLGSGERALAALETALPRAALSERTTARTRCFAVGHAHIDTAWLWPIRETKRKCLRTFANVLRLMEQYPEFRFLCSQPQQYAWVEEASPELFAEIEARVRDGRWEPGGATWVEPDCNLPSGESLIRQILHGTRYLRKKFGEHGALRMLYLPDTFGFPASLPQIMAQAGLDTFITNKLSWNETNEFPFTSFRWRGLDGTEVLAHCTPAHTYNGICAPEDLARGRSNVEGKNGEACDLWLLPFGYGDGGGGPTDWSIEHVGFTARYPDLPRTEHARADAFCRALHRQRAALVERGEDLPRWDGELYLELHRGTYTTMAALKGANRRAEQGLRAAEVVLFAAPSPIPAETVDRMRAKLEMAWKLLLLNQFHDIIPGTSIRAVNDEALVQLEKVIALGASVLDLGLDHWAGGLTSESADDPVVVFNPGSVVQSGVLEAPAALVYARAVPALGTRIVDVSAPADVEPVRLAGNRLSNGFVEVVIDDVGRVCHLSGPTGRSACRTDPEGLLPSLNQLVLYEDRPRAWEAWDIDLEHEASAAPIVTPPESIDGMQESPLRAGITVVRPLGKSSRITQRYVLEAGSPCLNIHTVVDWKESRTLLRALFPVDVDARTATYEIQFGHVERPTHRETSHAQAMFEACAHTWMDLSEDGFGVAILNDSKYGHSCHGNVMGLTLLRSTKFPDPEADMHRHEFTYGLMVHGGDWRAAGVDREAERMNAPLILRHCATGQRGPIGHAWAPFTIEADETAGVVISAVKEGAAAGLLIVRLVETHGGAGTVCIAWNLDVVEVYAVDVLERPLPEAALTHRSAARTTELAIKPFQIVTLAVQTAAAP